MTAIEFFTHQGTTPASPPLSAAVGAGDYVFVAGQPPCDEAGNIVGHNIDEQTRRVLNVARSRQLAGCEATLVGNLLIEVEAIAYKPS